MDLQGYVEGMIGFEGGGTNVVANPTGTPTDTLESIQIEDVIYNIDGGEEIVPTPTTDDRGKYLGVKSDSNELEYRDIREVPNTTGVELGNVLTLTVSGYMWSAPETELPSYTTADNDKVLGVHNGELEWVEQGGSDSHIYSTNEQAVGVWVDGSTVYEKSINYEDSIVHGDSPFNINIVENVKDIIECSLMYSDSGLQNGRYNPLNDNTAQVNFDMYGHRLYQDSSNLVGYFAGSSGIIKIVGVVRYTKIA